jgi:hypothetical protein
MNPGRWGRRLQGTRWRQSLGQQASRLSLLRGLGQHPMGSRGTWIRQAWLLRARRALSLQREWLEMMRERLDIIEQNLTDEIEMEEEAGRERPRRRPQPGSRPATQERPIQSGYAAERETTPERRRAALEAVFEEMQGHEEEFTREGRPLVARVRARLSDPKYGEISATGTEISEAFDAWKRRQESEESC